MRIGLVSQEYPPETAHGGIGSQTHAKAHGLTALGHDVHVLSASPDGVQRVRDDRGVRVTRIPGFDARLPLYTEPARWLTYSAAVAAAVAELHAQTPLDLLDFPEWGGEGFVHLLNQTEWNHLPSVIQLHGPLVMFAHTLGWPDLDSELYRVGTMMESTSLRLADAVYSSSQCSADWCAHHYGWPRERIPVLHTGVDTQVFQPRGAKSDRPTIVFVGNLVANKGVDLLLQAALRLAEDYPALQLRLFGRGETAYVEALRERARAAGPPDLLDIAGFVPRQELAQHLARAHVFALPSIYEGGPGFVYLEAMACGLPVIACSGSGAAEVVHHEVNGLLVPPGNLDGLVHALRRLLRDPAERDALGERGRRFAVEEADSTACLRRLEAFYAQVVGKRRAGGWIAENSVA